MDLFYCEPPRCINPIAYIQLLETAAPLFVISFFWLTGPFSSKSLHSVQVTLIVYIVWALISFFLSVFSILLYFNVLGLTDMVRSSPGFIFFFGSVISVSFTILYLIAKLISATFLVSHYLL